MSLLDIIVTFTSTMTASVKCATLSALLLCVLLSIVDSYQNTDMSRSKTSAVQ